MIRMFFTVAAALAVFVAAPSWAMKPFLDDKDFAKHHEFNTSVPTRFDGRVIKMDYAGGSFGVYRGGPEKSSKAILLIHEWWGLNAHIKGLADQLGRLGYATYAIDLYEGKVAGDPGQAAAYMRAVDDARALEKLVAALKKMGAAHESVGTIGWCFGGGWSLRASLAAPELVDATVIYYGLLVDDPAVLKKLKGPVLGIFATQESWINPGKVAAFEKALKEAGVAHEIKSYDADHAFANPSGERFKLAPARDAWKRTLDFFARHLR